MCHIVKNVDFVKNDGCADVRAVRGGVPPPGEFEMVTTETTGISKSKSTTGGGKFTR